MIVYTHTQTGDGVYTCAGGHREPEAVKSHDWQIIEMAAMAE